MTNLIFSILLGVIVSIFSNGSSYFFYGGSVVGNKFLLMENAFDISLPFFDAKTILISNGANQENFFLFVFIESPDQMIGYATAAHINYLFLSRAQAKRVNQIGGKVISNGAYFKTMRNPISGRGAKIFYEYLDMITIVPIISMNFNVRNHNVGPQLPFSRVGGDSIGFLGFTNGISGRLRSFKSNSCCFFGLFQGSPHQAGTDSGHNGGAVSNPGLEIGKYGGGLSGGRRYLLSYQVPLFTALGVVFAALCAYCIFIFLDDDNRNCTYRVLACALFVLYFFLGGTCFNIASGFWPAWIVWLLS